MPAPAATSFACPTCGATEPRPILFGMPTADAFGAADRGEIALGGCVVRDDDPQWECAECGTRWGDPALGRHWWSSEHFERYGLERDGFTGFARFVELPDADVPQVAGVYVVMRMWGYDPEFAAESFAGRFKGKDPTIDPDELADRWVDGARVLYIGKANVGASGRRGLRTRLDEYRRHGAGLPVGHWGGRAIWQLYERDQLLVAWRPVQSPDAGLVESAMLDGFAQVYGSLPFANRRR